MRTKQTSKENNLILVQYDMILRRSLYRRK